MAFLPLMIILSACTSASSPTSDVGEPDSPSTVDRPVPATPIVSVQSGDLQGVREDDVFVFRGIPYAAPPVGELRWREPQPLNPWQGVRKADAFGYSCIQPDTSSLEGAGDPGALSEDCLFLNVWTPSITSGDRLPVMVWIHGGGLVIGAGSLPAFTGAPLAQRDVVLVTFNYRLGPLGFFDHPALEEANPDGPVNFGLLDQIAALQWVQKNIAAFGGDPDNVTIFGQSAGGQSVLALMTSPLAQGLFHKGIVESAYGVISNPRVRALDAGIRLANDVGLNGADATLDDLRAVPAEAFAQVTDPLASLAPSFVVGDPVLPEPISDVFRDGREAPAPLIIGSNSDEASVAGAFGFDPALLLESLPGMKWVLKVLYWGTGDDSDLARQVIRDVIFTSFARRIAAWHTRQAPTWRYYFSYVPEKLRETKTGVGHGDEIVFVMDTMDYVPSPDRFTSADRQMAKRMGSYWTAFARTGEPDLAGEPHWPRFTSRKDRLMEFGERIRVRKNFMKLRLNFYNFLIRVLDWYVRR